MTRKTFITRFTLITLVALMLTSCGTAPSGNVPVAEATTEATTAEPVITTEATTETTTEVTTTAIVEDLSKFAVKESNEVIINFENTLATEYGLDQNGEQLVAVLNWLQYFDIPIATPEELWEYVPSAPFNDRVLEKEFAGTHFIGNYKEETLGFDSPLVLEETITNISDGKNLNIDYNSTTTVKDFEKLQEILNTGKPILMFLQKGFGSESEPDFYYMYNGKEYPHFYSTVYAVVVGYNSDESIVYFYDSNSPELQEYSWNKIEANRICWYHELIIEK